MANDPSAAVKFDKNYRNTFQESTAKRVGHDIPEQGNQQCETLKVSEAWVKFINSVEETVNLLEGHEIDIRKSFDINYP